MVSELSTISLDSSENIDEQSVIHAGNIELVDDKRYVFLKIKGMSTPQPFTCVDGGNSPIINFGSLVVELNKVVGVKCPVQGEPTRLGPFKFLNLTYASGGSVNTKIYHREAGLSFAPKQLDPKVLRGQSQTYVLAGRARRVMELLLATYIIFSGQPKVLLLDGSLGHTFDKAEINALNNLFDTATRSGVILAALTKVSSILYRGEPITHHVNRIAVKQGLKHYYTMVGKAYRGEMNTETVLYVVKLNSLAKKPYLLEVYNAVDEDSAANLIYTLARNANNIAIPGYPQALALADRYARVTAEEVSLIKTLLGKHREVPLIGEAYAHELLGYW
ncbi:MAG: hypothetical protein QW688_00545 [Thermoprotei archaeon]